MRKILLSSLLLIGMGCYPSLDFSGMFGNPVYPTPPGPQARVEIINYAPHSVSLDTQLRFRFNVKWDADSIYVNYAQLYAVFGRTDSCDWDNPIFLDTIKTMQGDKKFYLDYTFRGKSDGIQCPAFAYIWLANRTQNSGFVNFADDYISYKIK